VRGAGLSRVRSEGELGRGSGRVPRAARGGKASERSSGFCSACVACAAGGGARAAAVMHCCCFERVCDICVCMLELEEPKGTRTEGVGMLVPVRAVHMQGDSQHVCMLVKAIWWG